MNVEQMQNNLFTRRQLLVEAYKEFTGDFNQLTEDHQLHDEYVIVLKKISAMVYDIDKFLLSVKTKELNKKAKAKGLNPYISGHSTEGGEYRS